MNMEIYGETKRKHSLVAKSDITRLRLIRGVKGITVTVVDSKGERIIQGDLVTFTESGKLERHECINTEFGFTLNSNESIEVAGEQLTPIPGIN